MTTPRDAIGLSDRLREVERAELDVASQADCRPEDTANYVYAGTCREAATALDSLQARVKELEAERQEVREILAGSDYGSLPNDWTLAHVADARMDNISKLRWQVKDTCSRAEAAEARATIGLNERLRDDIAQLVTATKHAAFTGAETGVRVKDPSLLLTDMREAATQLDALQERVKELEQIERNRDMWKGQCERQAAQLTSLREDNDMMHDLVDQRTVMHHDAEAKCDDLAQQLKDLRVVANYNREQAEAAESSALRAEQQRDEAYERAVKCIPTNWCDELLTGPKAPRGPLDCQAIERLLLEIIKRIRRLAAETEKEGE